MYSESEDLNLVLVKKSYDQKGGKFLKVLSPYEGYTLGIFLPKEKARIIYTWETSSKGLCSVFKVIKAKFGIS